MIDIKEIKKQTSLCDVLHFESIDSTNTYLKKLAKQNKDIDRILVVADQQTAGKGRQNKAFYSPDSGLYASFLYRYPLKVEEMQLVTIVAAVVIQELLKDLCKTDVSIKWLNDIFLKQRKLCGILTEGVLSQGPHYDFIILGIGLNLKTPELIPNELNNIFIALDEVTQTFDKTDFLIHFTNKFNKYMENLETYKEAIIDSYKKHCFTLNHNVSVSKTNQVFYAYDINKDGHLIVKDEDGKSHTFNAGEISIIYED